MSQVTSNLIGIGLYSVTNVATLVHATDREVRRLVMGYHYQRGGIEQHISPAILRQLGGAPGSRVLTFQDLLQPCMVKQFRRSGVSLQLLASDRR